MNLIYIFFTVRLEWNAASKSCQMKWHVMLVLSESECGNHARCSSELPLSNTVRVPVIKLVFGPCFGVGGGVGWRWLFVVCTIHRAVSTFAHTTS
jgi:hypothetical protein